MKRDSTVNTFINAKTLKRYALWTNGRNLVRISNAISNFIFKCAVEMNCNFISRIGDMLYIWNDRAPTSGFHWIIDIWVLVLRHVRTFLLSLCVVKVINIQNKKFNKNRFFKTLTEVLWTHTSESQSMSNQHSNINYWPQILLKFNVKFACIQIINFIQITYLAV